MNNSSDPLDELEYAIDELMGCVEGAVLNLNDVSPELAKKFVNDLFAKVHDSPNCVKHDLHMTVLSKFDHILT